MSGSQPLLFVHSRDQNCIKILETLKQMNKDSLCRIVLIDGKQRHELPPFLKSVPTLYVPDTKDMYIEPGTVVKVANIGGGNGALLATVLREKALEKLDLVVTIDIFMNETAKLSDIVLPACSFLEQTGIGGYPIGLMHGISYIMKRKKVIEPIGNPALVGNPPSRIK
mgnify:CR=1 FL=1